MSQYYSEQEKRAIREDLIAALEATHPDPNKKKPKTKKRTRKG